MSTVPMKVAYTAPNTNALNAPTLNVLGMPTGVKLTHEQTYGQFSCVEVSLAPRQMGPPAAPFKQPMTRRRSCRPANAFRCQNHPQS